mmetsp:Transcript_18153/g.27135  ORF Transcript_18153/g.27135 Transcript_18153/m.27135 type:complete len:101 (-) Transcript_18153:100-402(-)
MPNENAQAIFTRVLCLERRLIAESNWRRWKVRDAPTQLNDKRQKIARQNRKHHSCVDAKKESFMITHCVHSYQNLALSSLQLEYKGYCVWIVWDVAQEPM